MQQTIRLVAISGSLRTHSSNTNILRCLGKLVPPGVEYGIFEGIGAMPHFSPGIEDSTHAVNLFRAKIKEADGVIFCTPEYAFGVPGVLKNALDWLVSSGEFNEKPVAAISASPLYTGGDKALASLLLTLTALGTVRSKHSSLSIGAVTKKIGARGEVNDPVTINELQALINHLIATINANRLLKDGQPTT